MTISGVSFPSSTYTPSSAMRSAASGAAGGKAVSTGRLSAEEEAEVRKLKARDLEVRQHEQAHLSAAGGLAVSGASFTYQKGPDGVNYAIGGEVNIDTSAGNTAEETLQRARTIRAAALAPAKPSGQDQAVAAQAGQMEQQASIELAMQRTAQATSSDAAAGDAGRGQAVARYYGIASSNGNGDALNIYA